ncbi:MAG: GDSL-type esterase/lipase family protein [Actinobacteria bacterium]|nr:GDSL-type esterase/lipase family protein [Actinomycetota bacterium]
MQIAFLGDSLTEGWPGAAYFPLLQARLPQHVLLNLGRAGDTVVDVLRRVAYRGLDPVDLAIIWVGVNDAVMGAWDAAGDGVGSDWGWAERLARISGDYQDLVTWTAARASQIVCVRPIVLEADGSVWQEHADELGDDVVRLAGEHDGARTLDLRPAFAAARAVGDRPFTIDGVHFTNAGATVVAAALAAAIEDIDRGETAASDTGD